MPQNLPAPPTNGKIKIKDPRDFDLAYYIALGNKYSVAGRKAKFSEKYVKTGQFYKKCKSAYITSIMDYIADSYPDHRRRMASVRLHRAATIEDTIYDRAEQDSDYAINPVVAKTLERDYKIAGLLADQSVLVNLVPVNVAIQVQNVFEGQEQPKTVLIENTEEGSKSDK